MRYLHYIKIAVKKGENQHFQNGRTDFLVTIIELLHFLTVTGFIIQGLKSIGPF